jgi:Cu-Zn family superoxide dismutase
VAATLAVGGAATATAQDATPIASPQATPQATPLAAVARLFDLPGETVYPEGVAYQEATGDFFVGSTTDGTIFRGDVETGEVEVFVQGAPGGSAVGMKVDDQGRLYVAGGSTGLVSVYDTTTGALIAEFGNDLAPDTFLNDIAFTTAGDAYVTDSFNPFVYVVPAAAVVPPATTPVGEATPGGVVPVGGLETAIDLRGGPFELGEGFNANGIVATPDDQYLLVAQSNTGTLFRIDLGSQEVVPVDLGGAPLPGDGMLLDGRTLYAVTAGEISVVSLAADYASGELVTTFADPTFSSPTTIARYDGCLLVVNSQFAAQQGGTPDLPFTVSGVPIPASVPGGAPPAEGC